MKVAKAVSGEVAPTLRQLCILAADLAVSRSSTWMSGAVLRKRSTQCFRTLGYELSLFAIGRAFASGSVPKNFSSRLRALY